MNTKGKFLVIDGTDGSGKETQTKMLISRLKEVGFKVEIISFPQYGKPSAGPTENYLHAKKYGKLEGISGAKKASVLYAVDRFDASFQIREWLEAGKIVVSDRYVASNMGHQGGKIDDPDVRREFFRWNDEIEYGIFEIPRPDMNLILHCPTEIARRRLDARDGNDQDLHQADPEHLRNAEKGYRLIAEMFEEMLLIETCPNNDELTPLEVHDLVWKKIQLLLNR